MMLKADGFDSAIVGIGRRCGKPDVLVYDVEKCIGVLKERGLSDEEAVEYFDFNVVGAWVGEETPVFVYPYSEEEEES